jgi:inositol oxygenase
MTTATLVNTQFKSDKENFYRRHHKSQTYAKAVELRDKYAARILEPAMVWERLISLKEVNDESDAELEGMTQLGHALQTANAIANANQNEDWIIMGLIHDLGKIIQRAGEKPEFTVGDVYPVGCQFGRSIVYYDYLKENPDWDHPVYRTLYGIYSPNCGLMKVAMSYGHDEYTYQIFKDYLPYEILWTIRHHSFQSVADDYTHLMNKEDRELRETHMKKFMTYDLYTKDQHKVGGHKLKYYQEIIERRFPEPLQW